MSNARVSRGTLKTLAQSALTYYRQERTKMEEQILSEYATEGVRLWGFQLIRPIRTFRDANKYRMLPEDRWVFVENNMQINTALRLLNTAEIADTGVVTISGKEANFLAPFFSVQSMVKES